MMSTEVERVVCYVCGSDEGGVWACENGWNAVRCSGCGLVFVNPRPMLASISAASQSGMHPPGDDAGRKLLNVSGRYGGAWKVAMYQRRLATLYSDGVLRGLQGRWLDVGCGYGEFLEALRVEAPCLAVSGSEPNEVKTQSARARGLDVAFRSLEEGQGSFTGVSLLNVFSHLPNPVVVLGRLHALLAPHGTLLLQTGNWAELERKDIPDRLCLPDHLSFASEALLRRLLENSGFVVERVVRRDMFPVGQWVQRRIRGLFGTMRPGPSDLWFRAVSR